MSEIVKVKITSKPSVLIAVTEWVWLSFIGIELDAVKVSKPWNLVMGGNAKHNIDCWEIEKEKLLTEMKKKKFSREAEWLLHSSLYSSSEYFFFNINSCEPIH